MAAGRPSFRTSSYCPSECAFEFRLRLALGGVLANQSDQNLPDLGYKNI